MNKQLPPFEKIGPPLINFKKAREGDFNLRVYLLPIFTFFVLVALITRLFQLTIVKGAYFRQLAEENRIREIDIEAPRGKILDRKGFTIAYSQQEENGQEQPKETITAERIYNYGGPFAHLVGYRQLASEEDLANDICERQLKLNDKVGKQGIEKIYQCLLGGKRGKKLIEVDASDQYIKTLSLVPPQPGDEIRLSVDLELQKLSSDLIKDKKAAVVATKPETGEVLVLVSSPSFDPQVFEENDQAAIEKYINDREQPLFNRALMGTYPPGSIFKLVVATGALEEGVIDENFQVEDTGAIKAGPLTFGNWYFLKYGKTEGMVDIVKGIRRSNDIFFYKVGEKLGVEKIRVWAQNLGFGKKTGLPLPEEEGLIPSPFWKKEVIGDRWFLGDTYNLSIGQGYLLVTPLQVNLVTSVFANGGYLCQPKLLKIDSLKETDVSFLQGEDQPNCQSLNLSDKTLDLVREGMRQACETGGTGWPFFDFKTTRIDANGGFKTPEVKNSKTSGVEPVKMAVGCKTGTAESVSKEKNPHAWFTVFAPWEKPEIVLTVLVEEGGEGSYVAAPIAKEILKAYFEREE